MDNLKRRHVQVPEAGGEERNEAYEHHDEYMKKEKEWRPAPRTPHPVYSSNKYIAFIQEFHEILIPVALTLFSFWTRFRRIGDANFVVWDEAHFGKFGSHYLKHDFYFDVHPPLGKMLVGLSGLLSGYDGSFEFESGATYPENLNYVGMRVFNAFWGALVVPLAYMTARELHFSFAASLLAATMVLLDTAYLCISRFILLDSLLLFFTCTSLYCLAVFHNLQKVPFSAEWWAWLTLTGLSLGCVSSVKWVGLFVVSLVGLYTIEDLWDKLGDLHMPKQVYAKHWIARIICLIVLPISVYLLSFVLHFAILYKSGSGDAQMSSLFQAKLQGNDFDTNPQDVAYDGRVSFKNFGYGGGLLHSHVQTYPEGSGQQQVTCYHHRDDNNYWTIRPPRGSDPFEYTSDESFVRFVKDGDLVRLVHTSTGRNLHSHPVNAPVSTSQFEVSAYGNETIGDDQDNWRVEIVNDISYKDASHVRSLSTRFRLRHASQGCLLMASNVILPQWGFKQVEVVCDKRNLVNNPQTWWNIEENAHDHLESVPRGTVKSRFFGDFWQLNVAMWTSNNALIPDPDKLDILSSVPTEWPFLSVGLRMCSWADNALKFYLLGNPVVWWGATTSIGAFLTLVAFYVVRMRRNINDLSPVVWDRFLFTGKTLFLGWLLHYLPFFIMGRVTYLHHYFPALYFSILMVPFLLDHLTASARPRNRRLVFGIAFVSVIGVFIYFAPIAYGMGGSANDFSGRQWLQTWNIVD